ncbi:MAG: glycogen-debranching protein [Chlamydiae bacterium]|nr:glycogen-debranching protein [Chlamydiota bacterium]
MQLNYQIKNGNPYPLGTCIDKDTVNFALFSSKASTVTLCLFSDASEHPFDEIPLNPKVNKTGSFWHIALKGLPRNVCYAYKITLEDSSNLSKTNYLLDPYAKSINSAHQYNFEHLSGKPYTPKCQIIENEDFDWQGVTSPNRPMHELIIYEMHVRGFTIDPSSNVIHPGVFLGVIEKIPYLKALGVNAVELLPIFEFNECENKHLNPSSQIHLHNYWGYSTVNFFSPMNRYSTGRSMHATIDEFKTMVRELHRNGIEVILDVVYNHTSEGGITGPTHCFKGIDPKVYYLFDTQGDFANFSGTGNTLNCNHPVVANLIIDSLLYWSSVMHVDGFRFDLASIFCRDPHGKVDNNPPIIQEILSTSGLKHVKLIAEAWDAAGLYQVGTFPGQGIWSEWNGKFRDVVRRFIKGTDGQAGLFATAISGSQDLFGNGGYPYQSINFVTAHDGYSLYDLVSYQNKHNLENGENNQDGANKNDSWNCGFEGPTQDPKIVLLRRKQIKNLLMALFLSVGTPMLLMGDEYSHTRKGNNNPYCQDNALNWFLWDELPKNSEIFAFCCFLIEFRKKHAPFFARTDFLSNTDISWHGHHPNQPDWSPTSRFVAFTMHSLAKDDIYIAYNADYKPAKVELPKLDFPYQFYKHIDTSMDFDTNNKLLPVKNSILLEPYSAILLKVK